MSLQVLVNGFDIANGVTHRINWVETTGLFDPAALVDPEAVDTFEGPFRVRQTTVDYGMREVVISGMLAVAASDYASKLRALDGLQAIYAPRPSRVVVGTLELSVDFGRVEVASDQLKRLNGMIKYTVRGTAIPATFACTYGGGTGLVQGIPVDTQRVNEAATLATMASGVGTITCLGDVPTPAVLTIQNNPAAVKVYYLATSATGRRVPISTDANGVGRIDERAGLYLAPGVNRITAYQAATGAATFTDITVMSFYGTTWRYSGNAVAGNATRFDLGPALTVNRTGSARVFRGNTNPVSGGTDGIFPIADDEPRIGWVWQNRRNLFINSNDLSSSASTTRTGIGTSVYEVSDPDGGSRAYRATSNASDSSILYGSGKLTSGAVVAGVQYTFSVWLRTAGANNTINALIYESTGTTTASWAVTSTWTRFSVTRTLGTPVSGFAFQIGGGSTWSSGETLEIYGPQFEIGASATAYQATDASGISLDHPVNDSGLVLEGQATNLCLRSEDIANATWSKNNVTNVSSNNLAPDGTLTAYQAESNAADTTITQGFSGLTIGSNYTFSVWLRTTSGVNTVNIYINEGASGVTSANIAVTTNWSRVSVTRTLVTTNPSIQIGGGTTWSTGEVVQIWGAQFEAGTAATSYIPTTTTSASRLGDVAGLVLPHNLLLYSEPISQGTIGAATTPWQISPWTAASSTVDSPQGADTSTLVNVNTSGTPGMYQEITVPGGVAGKTYTFSIWIRQNVTTASVAIRIMNQGAAATRGAPVTCSIDGTWKRFYVTATMDAADTAIRVRIDTYNAAGSILVFGAQLTEGYLPGRYVRTTDTQVMPVSMIDPSWSQNGYIEGDFIWPVVSQPSSLTHVYFGDAQTPGLATRNIFSLAGTSNQIGCEIWPTASSQSRVTFTDATIYSRGCARLRFEWTNYTMSGSRYMFIRLYADGILKAETNFAGSAGTSWPQALVTQFWKGRVAARGEQITLSNLVIGTPALPEGATAAGI